MPPDSVLEMWTVYESPTDYPGLYVARLWRIQGGEAVATPTRYVAASLEAIRQSLPPGLYRLPRSPEDDAVILETWL